MVKNRSASASPGALFGSKPGLVVDSAGSPAGGTSRREEPLDCKEGLSLMLAATRLEFSVDVDACPTDSVADSISADGVTGRSSGSSVSLLSSLPRSIDISKGNLCSMLGRLALDGF